MISWLQQNEFWTSFKEKSAANFVEQFETKIDKAILLKWIEADPLSNPDDWDEPGPCERWYGFSDEIPFIITYHDAGNDSFTTIQSQITSASKIIPWQILIDLRELPDAIFSQVYWIRGHQNDVLKSLFYQNEFGIRFEVYRAKDSQEAEDLLEFFEVRGTDYKYFVSDAENEKLEWLILRGDESRSSIEIGRYNLRSVAESVALQMSQKDSFIYRVHPHIDQQSYKSTFCEGKLVEK